ncbi:MAG: hypothetical protein F4W90_09095 [Gammaproteobacteria bacterium]|nr:hypothetical protein [Gammaproteobacteria bacterium]
MTPEQKQSFYQDGFLIFRDIVAPDVVNRAVRTLYGGLSAVWQTSMSAFARGDAKPDQDAEARRLDAVEAATRAGTEPAILDLVNPTSPLMLAIADALGNPVREPRGAQLATIFPSQATKSRINESGYPSDEVPFYGWHGHLDGLWNGAAPMHQRTDRPMNATELALWNRDPAKNGVRRTYPGNMNVVSFTALLGIPLSDQMQEGSGNLGLLKGAHHHMSRFFRYQREQGGPLGPDGPDWERIDKEAPNHGGLRHYPERVRREFSKGAKYTSDGRMWPKPEFIKVKPGDAVLALHAVPHSATRLEGHTPRLMAYFRLLSASRGGKEPQLNPDTLCNCWFEWEGMREVVASNPTS